MKRRFMSLVAAMVLAAAADAQPAEQPSAFDAMAPAPSHSRGADAPITVDDAKALAHDLRTALCKADESAGVPADQCGLKGDVLKTPPDANYVRVLRAGYEAARRATVHIPADRPLDALSDPTGARYLPPADEHLIANPAFDANLRKLYLAQLATIEAIVNGTAVPNAKIFGGSQIPEATDVVLLSDRALGRPDVLCTGTIITPTDTGDTRGTAVLTAAHCVCDWNAEPGGRPAIWVRVGQDATDGHPTKSYATRPDIALMDNVTCRGEFPTGTDLAVVTTSEPITSEGGAARSILAADAFAGWAGGENGYFVRIGGYGSTSGPNDTTNVDRRFFVDTAVDCPDCASASAAEHIDCKATDLVAGGTPIRKVARTVNTAGTVGIAGGDSGGPAYASLSASNQLDRFVVVGVTRASDPDLRTYVTRLSADVACWLRKVTDGRVRFVHADGTSESGSGQCGP